MPQMALHSSLFARISATTQDLLQKNTRPVQKELSELLTPQQLAACPQEFVCPISLDIMRDPVLLLPTGQIYDFHSLTHWFESGEPLKMPLHGLQSRKSDMSKQQMPAVLQHSRHCLWRQQGRELCPYTAGKGCFTCALMQDPDSPVAVAPATSAAHSIHAGCRRKILPAHRNAAGGHSPHAL